MAAANTAAAAAASAAAAAAAVQQQPLAANAQAVKIEPPKAFAATQSEAIDSWIYSMNLYFQAEARIPAA